MKLFNKIKPKRAFEELAEMGLLEETLKTKLKKEFETDLEFKEDMLKTLLEKSSEPSELLQIHYARALSDSFSRFEEKTKKWTQKP